LSSRAWLLGGWVVVLGVSVGVRLWNALAGPLMWGYDAWGHVAYVLFLDLYRAVPWADQGWSYFHPPLHYALGWLLARAGSGEVLMRGLPLLASAASLGTAAVAARLARRASPGHPGLALAAFAAVACLPVHYVVSAMPGNELSETFLTAATLAAFVRLEAGTRPGLAGAAVVGGLAGLSLLAKFSGLIALLAALACLALRPLLRGRWRETPGRALARAGVVSGVALLVCAPYYARNLREFGTPFQLSRDFALVTSVERDQPPGRRGPSDYLRFPLAAFSDPNPLAPHLLHSVWATVYLNVWADTYRESDRERALEAERGRRAGTSLMAALGLLPTALFVWGAGLAVRDVRGGRRREVYLPLLVVAAGSLAAFAVFTWQVPIWSALKASYLFGLSCPFAVFVARSLEAAGGRSRALQRALAAGLAAVAAVASALAASGLWLPRRGDAPATGAVRFYFGEYDEARRIYGRLAAGARYPVPWLENLAALELVEGDPAAARRFYARAVALAEGAGRPDAQRLGRLALATALDGELSEALGLFDRALALAPEPELLANRAAVRAEAAAREAAEADLRASLAAAEADLRASLAAAEADLRASLAAAEADLRASLAAAPEQVPAWLNLAQVLERLGRTDEARVARAGAAQAACRPPRGYPYGVGTGEVLEWGVLRRGLLLWEPAGRGLALALPESFRRSCG
jgi:tetratricopeptide (TPR) repeat protein